LLTWLLIIADTDNKTNGLIVQIYAIVSENIYYKFHSNIILIAFPDAQTPASNTLENF